MAEPAPVRKPFDFEGTNICYVKVRVVKHDVIQGCATDEDVVETSQPARENDPHVTLRQGIMGDCKDWLNDEWVHELKLLAGCPIACRIEVKDAFTGNLPPDHPPVPACVNVWAVPFDPSWFNTAAAKVEEKTGVKWHFPSYTPLVQLFRVKKEAWPAVRQRMFDAELADGTTNEPVVYIVPEKIVLKRHGKRDELPLIGIDLPRPVTLPRASDKPSGMDAMFG